MSRRSRLGVLAITLLIASNTEAQSASDRQAAANAFDRGSAAYLEGDYPAAARWFEMANNLVPAAPVVLQAIRAHLHAGNELRAGTLALRLIGKWPDSREVEEAQRVVDEARRRFFYVEVDCDAECTVELDGTLMAHPAFFVEPGTEVTVGATFDSGARTETLSGNAGEQRTVRFERPAGPPRADPDANQGQPNRPSLTVVPSPPSGSADESGGITPAVFITSLVLTAAAGAMLVWSGLDTLAINDDYETAASEEREMGNLSFPRASALLEDGQRAEKRTNALIGVTAGLGAITLLTAIFTDWGGNDDDDARARLRPSVGFGPTGGGVTLEGTF